MRSDLMKPGKFILIFALLNVAWAGAVVYLLATRSEAVAPGRAVEDVQLIAPGAGVTPMP